jgi:hypothetical protein
MHDNLHVPMLLQHLNCCARTPAYNTQVNPRIVDLQPTDRDLVQPHRQDSSSQRYTVRPRVDPQSKNGLQALKETSRRPHLRFTCDGIRHRTLVGLARKAAEEFWQAMIDDAGTGVEEG